MNKHHQTIGIYAGSFDPPTMGHAWMIRQGARLFDRFEVAVGFNPEKKLVYPVEQRMAWLRQICPVGVGVGSFENKFLARYAGDIGATHLLRGIRNINDFLFEQGVRNINADLNPTLATVFLMPPRDLADISSSVVRGMMGPEGWQDAVRQYVPECVWKSLCQHG